MRTMRTKNIFHFRTGMLLFLVLFFSLCSAFAWADEIIDPGNFLIGLLSPPSATGGVTLQTRPDEGLLETAYAGGETLRYTVSWLGIPAGELVMQVSRITESSETFALEITARSAGLLAVFYPVEDHFRTVVQGKMRLPTRHEMQQKEGRRVNRRLTLYDQERFRVSYSKNDEPQEIYQVEGPMQNEISSFFFMRTLLFDGKGPMIVPTFADKKRHEVVVAMEGREEQQSVLGRKKTIKLRPRLKFKGLYEKMGDPFVWLTDDGWRIPTRIQAKIVIGALTAELVEYSGPAGNFTLSGTPKE